MLLSCDERIWGSTEDLACINNHAVVGPYSCPRKGRLALNKSNGSQILYINCSQWYKRQLFCLCVLKYFWQMFYITFAFRWMKCFSGINCYVHCHWLKTPILFWRYVMYMSYFYKRPTGHNGHLRYQRLYTDFLSEGLIFVYQQPHHRINENQWWYRKAAS